MTYKVCTVLATVAAVAAPGIASAARFSWFDEMPARDSLGQVRAPVSLSNSENRLTFGIDAYKSLVRPRALDEDYDARGLAIGEGTVVSFYGELAAPRQGDFRAPLMALNSPGPDAPVLFGSPSSRLSGFGVKWQHRVDSTNTVAFSAGYSENPWSVTTPNLDALDTRAALSWRGQWSGSFLQPGLTGSVFVGDESVRDEAYQQLGRRYYGFSVGGEVRVGQDHVPYLSYRLKRNLYNPDDPTSLSTPFDDRSQISAGWKWQIQPNWSLQAEARYGLNGTNLDPYSPDRSRIFFGTRFDFR